METPSSTLEALTRLRNLPRGLAILLVLVGLALISGLDYVTGLDYTFSLFYYLVVAAAALLLGRGLGFATAVLTVILWTLVSLANGLHYGQIWGLVWAVATRATTLALLVALVTTLQGLAFELGNLAQRDSLTHVLNRRTFTEILDREVRKANRYDRSLTFAYFDVDDFKGINDRDGHQVGDRVLKALVSTLQDRIRPEDALARFGGDEFVLLLPDLSYPDAQTALDRIFGTFPTELLGGASVSVGAITFFPVPQDLDFLVHQVDQVLYEVKRSGKGRLLHRNA
jgi:diguanylate cyclase (GGDEF)-like protein